MKHYLEILKNLTPEQCVDIAKIACPGYQWAFFTPMAEQKWNGHDVVTNTTVNGMHLRTFQIDYGVTTSNFRFYNEKLFEIPIENSILEIFQYLADLQSKETIKPIENKGEISDGYHTFNELYSFRLQYNAAFFNQLALHDDYRNCQVHKSKKHSDGSPCFDGTYFIVLANLPTGQISNHYKMEYWDVFNIPEEPQALFEYDCYTGEDVLRSLKEMNDGFSKNMRPVTKELLVLDREYLAEEYKDFPVWAIRPEHLNSGVVKKIIHSNMTIFVGKDGETAILKNRYGKCTNTLEVPKKDTTHKDNIAKFLSFLQDSIESLADDQKRYEMCLLVGKFDNKKEKKKAKKEYGNIISKLGVLYNLKDSYLSIFSKEIK